MAFCKLNNLLTVFDKRLVWGGPGKGGGLVLAVEAVLGRGLWGALGGAGHGSEAPREALRRRAGPGGLREGRKEGRRSGPAWVWGPGGPGRGWQRSPCLCALCSALASALLLRAAKYPARWPRRHLSLSGRLEVPDHGISRAGFSQASLVAESPAAPQVAFPLCPRGPGISVHLNPLLRTLVGPTLRASFHPITPFEAQRQSPSVGLGSAQHGSLGDRVRLIPAPLGPAWPADRAWCLRVQQAPGGL